MADPVSTAQIDPVFQSRLEDLQAHAAAEGDARPQGNQVSWCRPAGWAGNVFDLAAFAPPFDTKAATADYMAAVKTPGSPGTTSDLIATTTQIDFIATMERAFRARQTLRRPRAVAHMAARAAGHGNSQGPLTQLGLEYVRAIIARGKASQ